MAKWDLSKLPEGRKPLTDEWFAERAQMQERINGLEELLLAAENDAKEAEAYAGELEAKNERLKDALTDLMTEAGDDPEIMAASRAEWAARAKAAEDKLAKAVAFAEIVEKCGNGALWDLARTTLAELTSSEAANGEAKGGKDE